MAHKPIFCPHDHLILDKDICPECNWRRPPRATQGSLLWQPVDLGCGIGGSSVDAFSRTGIVQDIAVFPLRGGGLVGIKQEDGKILWQNETSLESVTNALFENGVSLLASFSDNRPLGEAENGCLARIDPSTGKKERVWEGNGFTLTDPVRVGDLVFVRTAKSKLMALNASKNFSTEWEATLKSYKPLPPLATRDMILVWDSEVTKEKGLLKSYSLDQGKLLWQTQVLDIDCQPASDSKCVYFRSGKKILTALDLKDGRQLWQQNYGKIYSPPAICDGRIFVILRGDCEQQEPGYYCLGCLDPNNGDLIWQAPIGIRAQEILPLLDQGLLVGMGDAVLAICSPQDGSILWQHSFGEEKVNRVQTHLVVKDGICWIGTYEGKAAAICLTCVEEELRSPEEYLMVFDYDNAAAAYALMGELAKSAEIYMDKLNQPQKAQAIFQKLKDVPGQIRVALSMGDDMSAARLSEELGDLAAAANYYEGAKELRKAMHLHKKMGNKAETERLRNLIPLEVADIDLLEEEGLLTEAGRIAMNLGEFRRAVDLLERAKDATKELRLDALFQLCENEPEPWSLEMLADLARSQGQFVVQAQALEKLHRKDQAATAYLHAAKQMEARQPGNVDQIAEFYEKACELYGFEGMKEESLLCEQSIRRYRKIPHIQLWGESEGLFREGEWNVFQLKVENEGYGLSDDINIRVPGEKFQIDEDSFQKKIPRLGVGKIEEITVPIRPAQGQVGDGVPFILEWDWKDMQSRSYKKRTTIFVNVKRREEVTPQSINIYGDWVGQKGDKIEINRDGSGKSTESGKQKGDRIMKDKDGHLKLFDSELGEITANGLFLRCPNCSLMNEKDAKICDACGQPLTNTKSN